MNFTFGERKIEKERRSISFHSKLCAPGSARWGHESGRGKRYSTTSAVSGEAALFRNNWMNGGHSDRDLQRKMGYM